MADLLARFKLVDEMSDKLGSMAESGQNMISQWEQAGEAVNTAFEGVSSAVAAASSTVDGVATSIDGIQGAADNAASSADTLTDSISGYGAAAGEAASQTDFWTDAVGNYDKSALEAVYSTEELVEMGLKSAQALEEQERMLELCDQSAGSLSRSIEATADIEAELAKAVEEASAATEELNGSEKVSAETKAELAKASVEAAEAMSELTRAQQEAEAAMEAYDAVMMSGTTDLNELEAAAERACHAAENLAEANGKASEASEELSKATQKATEEAENSGKKGVEAVEGVASALAAAGITAMVKEIAEAVYELATAFSEAESTVVKATGATGDALDGLTASMMDAYAASKSGSLDDTAGAIGEINTRMGLTGDKLTEVTGLFLDYANITGTNVVGSVQNVTKVMNQWGVEADDVESVLDKLAYAGQISGASVDSLSSTLISGAASFQQAGLSLDNTIQMLADFELAGISSTTAITAMRTAVNHFSDEGLDAEEALQGVITEIANMENAADATALAVDTFGSRAGQQLAAAIRNGTVSVDTFSASLETADGTLKTTAEAAQTLDQKWSQASKNISTAFTTAVQPTLDSISSGLAGVMNGIGDFLNEHPAVTKAITAIGVGLGVAVVAIGAVAVASLTAIPAVAALGTAINAAIWPITLIAAGVAAVVGVVMLLADAFSAAEDETAGMTATTRAQYYELQDLNAEYEEACATYGENSEEALRLKYQVDDLTAAFEASRQTVEEFRAEVDELCESVSQVTEDFNSAMTEISANETGTLSLIQKYEDLATKTNRTAAEEQALQAVTKKLNDTYPELAQRIGSATTSAEDYAAAMKKACEQEAEELRQQQAQETYVEALAKRAELTEEIAKAQENVNLEQARMDDMSGWTHFWTAGEWDDLEAYQAALDELNAAQAENEATIAQIEQGWADIAAAEEEAANQTVSYEDAVTTALDSVQTEMDELCEAYDAAYEAARSSIDSTIGLFDTMKVECETSVEDMMSALESQTEYLKTYAENLKLAAQYGLDDGLIQSLSDGSTESAAYLQEIISNIEELGGTTEGLSAEAQAFVDNFNGAFTEVETAKDQFATTVADMETDFSTKVDEIGAKMQEMVEDMNMSDEAAAQASATLDSYISSIKAKQAEAVSAAEAVAAATAAALSATASSSAKVSVPGHARGTTNAERAFVAGEEGPELVMRTVNAYANGTTDSTEAFIAGDDGPELIVGQQGSTVFPTEETDRLIDALSGRREQPLQVFGGGDNSGSEKPSEQVKRILLEIAGSGAIEIGGGGGVDKESVLEILYEHLKPVLMNIIQGEIYEEGELSYEY